VGGVVPQWLISLVGHFLFGMVGTALSNEVAWRFHVFRWSPECGWYRKMVGEYHDLLTFRLRYSLPITCYSVNGVSQYGNWFIAEKRLLTITEYTVSFVVSEVSSEPVVKYRIEDAVFKASSTYRVGIPHAFDAGVVRRIVDVAEKINQMPYHFANLVTVDADGYLLRVVKSKPTTRYRPHGNDETYYIRFDRGGKITSTGGFNLPISLFI
jgi:hypothetical protein